MRFSIAGFCCLNDLQIYCCQLYCIRAQATFSFIQEKLMNCTYTLNDDDDPRWIEMAFAIPNRIFHTLCTV